MCLRNTERMAYKHILQYSTPLLGSRTITLRTGEVFFLGMLFKLVIQAGLAISALAIPTGNHTGISWLAKRSNPTIGGGWEGQETDMIRDGFADALRMAKAVEVTPATTVDPILKQWFREEDKDVVIEVFQKILGGVGTYSGNTMLSKITVIPPADGSQDEEDCSDEEVVTILRGLRTSRPKLIICLEKFDVGGIDKGYTGVPAVTCSTIGDKVSTKMNTMGRRFLHEYTHWEHLVVPPLFTATHDWANGPYAAQNDISKAEALYNADSYAYFASQVFWTVHCGHEFDPPTEDSDAGNDLVQISAPGSECTDSEKIEN
ncbi:uncharacterized protein N7459_002424 [Penicillium hispanicum]|uniref:uncharacterized protein n=1 Tax=Penicillium hispanicum TaxID=1080232 RepID=UPI002540B743|nr:uncharacterized protein N7459_002424 [Penicillium hispanicum]KAJ5592055.1 hypothetical protein N7459_002424 [Penicillium hispanicum]